MRNKCLVTLLDNASDDLGEMHEFDRRTHLADPVRFRN